MSDNTRITTPERPYRHSLPVQLRFNDVDMFGHVNNTVYLQFFDLGKLRYFEQVLGKDFMRSGLAVVIVNINCDFCAPSFINEDLSVLTQVTHIGEKSLTLGQRVVNAAGDVKCICRTVMAGFDPATLQSAPIPGFARAAFEKFEDTSFALND